MAVARKLATLLAWGLLALVVLLVLQFLLAASRKYMQVDSATYGMFWTRRAWLWAHLGGGAIGMLLGPLQFLARLRERHPCLHRWTGRAYLLSMLVACAGAAGLIATSPAATGIRIAFAATALAWLVAALQGYRAIRARRIDAHRQWMLRAYLVTLAPVAFRSAITVPGLAQLAAPTLMIPLLLWLSWAAPLMVYEGLRLAARTRRFAFRPARG